MDSHKLAVKFFADPALAADIPEGSLVPVFHGWIRERRVPGHLLVDVADYQHVPEGPGTVLIAHEANIHLDKGGGRPGLLYVRKQPVAEATNLRGRLTAVFRAALEACARLEDEPALQGKLRFRTGEALFRVYDRLLAPNTPETFEAVRSQLEGFLSDLYAGAHVSMDHRPDPLRLFEVTIKATSAPSVTDLLARSESAAPSAPSR